MFDPELSAKLAAIAVPFFAFWFVAGTLIATLYHLSLYYLDGEYPDRGARA